MLVDEDIEEVRLELSGAFPNPIQDQIAARRLRSALKLQQKPVEIDPGELRFLLWIQQLGRLFLRRYLGLLYGSFLRSLLRPVTLERRELAHQVHHEARGQDARAAENDPL